MHSFTQQQIKDTLKIIESTIVNCEKVQPKSEPPVKRVVCSEAISLFYWQRLNGASFQAVQATALCYYAIPKGIN